jgi:DNA polymerase-3 subunit delta'
MNSRPPASSPDGCLTSGMTDPWATVVGQERAVTALQAAARSAVHAYLLAGPRGSGKRDLARAFAASLLASSAPNDPDRTVQLALAGRHPDLHEFERAGPYITVEQADSIIREASRSGVESNTKVLVLVDFHLVQPAVEAKLLKTIEEPPPGTVFVVLAETVSSSLEPIASRCVRIEVDPLSPSIVREALVNEGIDEQTATTVSAAAGGDLARARLLATDPGFSSRQQAWAGVPHALDDSGATVARLVTELRSMIDDAAAPLEARHAVEIAEFEERIERYGERGSRKRELLDRHRRELRRHRTDEIRFGLATLAGSYRDTLSASPPSLDPRTAVDAIALVDDAHQSLERNPNETLLLQALLLRLPVLRVTTPV